MADFASRLKQLRTERDLLQKELADKVDIPRSTIAAWESGNRTPELGSAQALADFFEVSLDYLMARTNDPHGTFLPTPDPNAAAVAKIAAALTEEPELAEFWDEISRREDLFLMFKQVRDLSPESIRKIIRVIKAIEDEEAE